MATRVSLGEQLEIIERLVERAKSEKDWPTIELFKATAELVCRATALAETLTRCRCNGATPRVILSLVS